LFNFGRSAELNSSTVLSNLSNSNQKLRQWAGRFRIRKQPYKSIDLNLTGLTKTAQAVNFPAALWRGRWEYPIAHSAGFHDALLVNMPEIESRAVISLADKCPACVCT